jgi:prophage regulatory protein
MVNLKLVRKNEARIPFACGKTLFQQKINAGLVPPPIKLSSRAVAFFSEEINATLAVTIAGYSDEQIKDFVATLVEKRKTLLNQYMYKAAAND